MPHWKLSLHFNRMTFSSDATVAPLGIGTLLQQDDIFVGFPNLGRTHPPVATCENATFATRVGGTVNPNTPAFPLTTAAQTPSAPASTCASSPPQSTGAHVAPTGATHCACRHAVQNSTPSSLLSNLPPHRVQRPYPAPAGATAPPSPSFSPPA